MYGQERYGWERYFAAVRRCGAGGVLTVVYLSHSLAIRSRLCSATFTVL